MSKIFITRFKHTRNGYDDAVSWLKKHGLEIENVAGYYSDSHQAIDDANNEWNKRNVR